MVIGKYRITPRGYVVFGSTGIALLIILAMLVTQVFGTGTTQADGNSLPNNGQTQNTGQNSENPSGSANGTDNTNTNDNTANSGSGTTGGNSTETTMSKAEVNKLLGTASCTVYFKPDDYVLNEDFYGQLNKVVEMSKRFKEAMIVLDGHFNGVPGDKTTEFRVGLAQNRAEMVEAYLISQGVDPGRVTVNNLGCKVPVNKDDSWQEIQKNRRVEVYFKSFE